MQTWQTARIRIEDLILRVPRDDIPKYRLRTKCTSCTLHTNTCVWIAGGDEAPSKLWALPLLTTSTQRLGSWPHTILASTYEASLSLSQTVWRPAIGIAPFPHCGDDKRRHTIHIAHTRRLAQTFYLAARHWDSIMYKSVPTPLPIRPRHRMIPRRHSSRVGLNSEV